MEEVFGTAARGVLALLRFVLHEVIGQIGWTAMYWVGRGTLAVVTFGRYPQARHFERHEGRITLFGFLVSIVITILLVAIFS